MLEIREITFKRHFVTIDVRQNCLVSKSQREELVSEIAARYLNIANHHCVNSQGPHFSDCMKTTNLAHVLEHLIIEKSISRETQNKCEKSIGCTRRVGEHDFVIKLTYDDDIEMLRIIKDSIIELNEILGRNL